MQFGGQGKGVGQALRPHRIDFPFFTAFDDRRRSWSTRTPPDCIGMPTVDLLSELGTWLSGAVDAILGRIARPGRPRGLPEGNSVEQDVEQRGPAVSRILWVSILPSPLLPSRLKEDRR